MRCVIYMAVWGILCFPLGRLFKRMGLDWERPPFREWKWERSGRVYERVGIRVWKDIAPDVSKLFPFIVPKKTVTGRPTPAILRDMLAETCVAELTHYMLIVAGLAMIFLWPCGWGVALYLVYAIVGNAAFVMIQRYNRPRFRRMLAAAEAWERRHADARTDSFEQ